MAFDIGSVIGGGLSLVGGLLGGRSAERAADTGAAGQIRAAEIGAEAARFKPYNITTALGGVRFGDQTADITYNPALARYRDQLFGLAGSTLPEDIRAAEEAEYRRLLEGSRGALEQQTAALGQGLFRSGRQGLDIYGANPEMRAFASGLMDRELALRSAAEQQVANRIAQSTGLFTSGVGVENALLQPLDLGAQLGGRAAQAGATVGQLLGQGMSNAATLRMQGDIMGSSLRYNTLNDLLGNRQIQQGISGLFNRQPSIYNTYGQGGMGTVPMLDPNAGFGTPGYNALDM